MKICPSSRPKAIWPFGPGTFACAGPVRAMSPSKTNPTTLINAPIRLMTVPSLRSSLSGNQDSALCIDTQRTRSVEADVLLWPEFPTDASCVPGVARSSRDSRTVTPRSHAAGADSERRGEDRSRMLRLIPIRRADNGQAEPKAKAPGAPGPCPIPAGCRVSEGGFEPPRPVRGTRPSTATGGYRLFREIPGYAV
jgi:hypothetical protein